MRGRRAFTLVELLVVVGMIAVLVAILLPVLSMARQRAEAVVCASNLRQVALAMAAYEADNRSFPFVQHPGYGRVAWDGMFLDKCWVDVLLERRYLVGPDMKTRTLGVLGCPSVADDERWIMAIDPGLLSRCFTDYGYNWLANPGPPESDEAFYRFVSFRGQRGRMARGERKVLLAETWSYGGYWDEHTSRSWSEGHGWYASDGGGWDSALGILGHPGYETRHMRGRATTVAYMAGNIELIYPPPAPMPGGDHPLSREHFMYSE